MRLLIIWDYDRTDLAAPLMKLADEAELFFLYKYDPDKNDSKYDLNILYWNDFKNPYEILQKIRPDKLVFMEIETFHQVALNITSLNKNIPTYRLEHGIKAQFSSYVFQEKNVIAVKKLIGQGLNPVLIDRNIILTNPVSKRFSTLIFYLSSFRLRNLLYFYPFLKFIFTRFFLKQTSGLAKCKFKLRNPDYYIDFTLFNSRFIIERDNPDPSKFRFIGNPSFDQYFHDAIRDVTDENSEDYFLLIDSALVEDNVSRMDPAILTRFYFKLNEYCLERKTKLKIKLHPLSYNADYLPSHPNIIYLRQINLMKEIQNCIGCFHSHFSTLTPLVIYYKQSILFDAINIFNNDIRKLKIIPVLDFFNFNPGDIKFEELAQASREILIRNFLFSTDGNAWERLKMILTT